MNRSFIYFGFVLLIAVGAYFLFPNGADRQFANITLHESGKTYLYSKMGQQIVASQIESGQSPTVMPFLEVFSTKKGIFLNPLHAKEVICLINGAYQIFPYQEPSFDGYVTLNSHAPYRLTVENQAGKKIGKQFVVYHLHLQNESGREKEIVWSINTSSGEMKAIQNCNLKSFSIQSNPHPGETVISSKKLVVIDVEDLISFFGNGIRAEYDKKNALLHIFTKN